MRLLPERYVHLRKIWDVSVLILITVYKDKICELNSWKKIMSPHELYANVPFMIWLRNQNKPSQMWI